MNTDTIALLKNYFDLAITAPDGIKRLRETILTLAMQGKLVPQDPKDQPASELLKEIEAEKKRLVKEGKIKEPKPLPPINPEEGPYEVPESWEWVKLGNVTSYVIGKTPDTKNPDYWSDSSGYYWASIGDLPWHGDIVTTKKKITKKASESVFSYPPIPDGSLLMSFKLSIGKTAIAKVPLYHNEAIVSFYKLNEGLQNWLYQILTQVTTTGEQKAAIMGNTLNSESLRNLLIPLPPLAEQCRIVAKIDELMARVDELERKRDARNEKRLAMHQAAIARLLDAGDANASRTGRDFIFAHFGELYGTKENVAELRKAILQLAVMGCLVPQDSQDQPASELLKEIEAEKKRLVQEGKIKEPKPLPPIKPEEVPYQVPKGWEWVRFAQITINRDSERIPIEKEQRKNIQGDYDYYGASGVIDKVNDFLFDKDLLLIGEDGANLVTRSTPIAFFARGKYWVNNHAHVIDSTHTTVLDYLEKCINSIDLKPYVTGTAQPKMNQEKMNSILIPLPPLPEQRRIVAKVDELMALCDKLDTQIDERTAKESALLEAVAARV